MFGILLFESLAFSLIINIIAHFLFAWVNCSTCSLGCMSLSEVLWICTCAKSTFPVSGHVWIVFKRVGVAYYCLVTMATERRAEALGLWSPSCQILCLSMTLVATDRLSVHKSQALGEQLKDTGVREVLQFESDGGLKCTSMKTHKNLTVVAFTKSSNAVLILW